MEKKLNIAIALLAGTLLCTFFLLVSSNVTTAPDAVSFGIGGKPYVWLGRNVDGIYVGDIGFGEGLPSNDGTDIGDVTLNNTDDITVTHDGEVVSVDATGQGNVPVTIEGTDDITVTLDSEVVSVDATGQGDVPITLDSERVGVNQRTYDIALGNVSGDAVRRFGHNELVGTSWETMYCASDLRTWLTSAEQLLVVSDDADDTGGGAGARTVWLQGLDSSYEIQSETVTMTGATAVTATNSYLRVFMAKVTAVGASGFNEGEVSIQNNAGDNTLLLIEAEANISHGAIYTVPAGETFYMTSLTVMERSNKGADFGLYVREFGGVWQQKRIIPIIQNTFTSSFDVPYAFSEKTDIEMRVKGAGSDAIVAGGFKGWWE